MKSTAWATLKPSAACSFDEVQMKSALALSDAPKKKVAHNRGVTTPRITAHDRAKTARAGAFAPVDKQTGILV